MPKSANSMDIPNRGRLPSILLAQKPLFTARKNDTTATARSEDGYLMSVSFWMTDPPEMSLFSIHCSKPQDLQHMTHSNFSTLPRVVGADGPFVLLRAAFYCGSHEYFLYTAGDHPRLERIPSPDESDDDLHVEFDESADDLQVDLGILGHGGGDNYLLADLRDAPSSECYLLRIYSSETKSWSTRRLRNPCPGVDRVIPDKVITLGQGGLLGWVDLSRGLLVCDLLLLLQHQDQDPPVPGAVSFIPLPEPLPGNIYNLKCPIPPTQKRMKTSYLEDGPSHSSSWFRDLACVNGELKFVEMENPAPSENKGNIIYDSDLIMSIKHNKASKHQLSSFTGAWRAVIWTRKVSPSSNFWRQTTSAPFAHHLLTDDYSAFPIIRPGDDGDDDIILYVKTVEELSHRDGQVAALDIIGNMALRAIGRYYLPNHFDHHPGYDHEHPFRACTLSRHLNMTPGNQVSECHKIIEESSSANHPSKTSIRVGSCEPRTAIQRLSELPGKNKRPRSSQ